MIATRARGALSVLASILWFAVCELARRRRQPVVVPRSVSHVRVPPREPVEYSRPIDTAAEVQTANAVHRDRWRDSDGYERGAALVQVRIEGRS